MSVDELANKNPVGPPAGALYLCEYVLNLLDAEDAHRESLESRARAAIASSGTLVTLLLAFAGLVKLANIPLKGGVAVIFLCAAAILFGLSSIAAIVTALPQRHDLVDLSELREYLPLHWRKSPGAVLSKLTATRLEQIATSRKVTSRKARLLGLAVLLQVLAVVSVVCTVIVILIR